MLQVHIAFWAWIVSDHTVYCSTFTVLLGGKMTLTSKMATLTFRIKPILKEALRTAASQEHRSLSNMVEMLILDYCDRNGINIREMSELLVNKELKKV